LEDVYFRDWISLHLEGGGDVLDVGCGTGRHLVLMAQQGIRTVGVDISEEMLLAAREKIVHLGAHSQVELILADAEQLPLKNQVFDACVLSGTLHHLARPLLALQEAASKVRTGGAFYSFDPHDSPVRFVFNWMMKVWRLWEEEASDDPLFTEDQLRGLYRAAGIVAQTRISTYLPPHLFCLLGSKNNARLLRLSDNVFRSIPLIKKLGGVVIVEGVRNSLLNPD
jgi:SAM-dependent methyltransferase